jgi:hypothetical protein
MPAGGPAAAKTPLGATGQAAAELSPIGLVALLGGCALSNADVFIVNVALTSIGRGLRISDNLLELVVSGYGITYALGLVVGGRLGDSFGRRRVFVYGVVGFTISWSILSQHSMRTGLLAVMPFSIGFGALLFVYALVRQGNFELDGIESGAVLAPFAAAFFVASLFTPKIAARLGRRIVALGAVLQGTGLLLLALVLGAAVGGTLFLSTGRAIGDEHASLVVIGLLTIFSVVVLCRCLVLPEPK